MKLFIKIKSFLNIKTKLKKGKVTKGSPTRRVPDIKKTLKLTKLKKLVKLKEGIEKTIEWFNKIN